MNSSPMGNVVGDSAELEEGMASDVEHGRRRAATLNYSMSNVSVAIYNVSVVATRIRYYSLPAHEPVLKLVRSDLQSGSCGQYQP